MNTAELVSNINGLLLPPPSLYQGVMKRTYTNDNEKYYAVWQMYFSYMWRELTNAIWAKLEHMCKEFKCLAYREEYNTYLKKHGKVDLAYLDYLDVMYRLDHIKPEQDTIRAVFTKGRSVVLVEDKAGFFCAICQKNHASFTTKCISNDVEIKVPISGWSSMSEEDKNFRENIKTKLVQGHSNDGKN
jgi:hypothetical protein